MLNKIQKKLLFFIVLFVPLNWIPKSYAIPVLGQNISVAFLMLGLIILGICVLKDKSLKIDSLDIYVSIFILWQLVCLISGLLLYEYDNLLNIYQVPFLPKINQILCSYNINIEEEVLLKVWLFLRHTKHIIYGSTIAALTAFFIKNTFKDDFSNAYELVKKAILIFVVVMGCYSLIELAWLKFDYKEAGYILETVNPYIYDVRSSGSWWPPLLWKNQLRSIMQEPSFFGFIAIFTMPFLWYRYVRNRTLKNIFLIFMFTFMLFATNARTGIIVFLGQLGLLVIGTVYVRNNRSIKTLVVVLGITISAFLVNLVDFNAINISNSDIPTNTYVSDTSSVKLDKIENYIANNVTSIGSTTKRSNGARLWELIGTINVVVEHPIMGVGTGLQHVYIDMNLPYEAFRNWEVMHWSEQMYRLGVFRAGYPGLNNYASIAVKNGLIGMILFLALPVYILIWYLKNIHLLKKDNSVIFMLISMLGLLVAMLSNSGFMILNGIVWGLLLLKINEYKKKGNDNVTNKA